jgi:hypothetical protein
MLLLIVNLFVYGIYLPTKPLTFDIDIPELIDSADFFASSPFDSPISAISTVPSGFVIDVSVFPDEMESISPPPGTSTAVPVIIHTGAVDSNYLPELDSRAARLRMVITS